jgi:hypothetical protein
MITLDFFITNEAAHRRGILQIGLSWGLLSAPRRSSHHIEWGSLHFIQRRLSGAVRYLCLGTCIAQIFGGLLKRRILSPFAFAGDGEPIRGDATVDRGFNF